MTDPVEILARELCAQESEIWEEAGLAYRKRWRNEAAAKLRADAMLAAREGKE